jgi:hypothetical protein
MFRYNSNNDICWLLLALLYLDTEDGGSMDLRNVGILPQTAVQTSSLRTHCTMWDVVSVKHTAVLPIRAAKLDKNRCSKVHWFQHKYYFYRFCTLSFIVTNLTLFEHTDDLKNTKDIYKGVSKSFRTESITIYTLTFGITR